MLNIPPHLEACRPRGLFSIFHGTSSPVARRCPRASDLVLSAEHAFLLYERPGLHFQSGASAVGGVLHGARRSSRCFSFGAICDFNPRAPCGARRQPQRHPVNHLHISIHAPRAGCDPPAPGARQGTPISIHAPRAGCDSIPCGGESTRTISIHAPRAGCDEDAKHIVAVLFQFQSTHPVRGATQRAIHRFFAWDYFNPRTPCGVRLWAGVFSPVCCDISIHAPRAGCDDSTSFLLSWYLRHFNPRTPCGVRHAAKAGVHFEADFNPRTPCGVRHVITSSICFHASFQSTHPVRGATVSVFTPSFAFTISIHAPRAGCDLGIRLHRRAGFISIHAPRAGCDYVH